MQGGDKQLLSTHSTLGTRIVVAMIWTPMPAEPSLFPERRDRAHKNGTSRKSSVKRSLHLGHFSQLDKDQSLFMCLFIKSSSFG